MKGNYRFTIYEHALKHQYPVLYSILDFFFLSKLIQVKIERKYLFLLKLFSTLCEYPCQSITNILYSEM